MNSGIKFLLNFLFITGIFCGEEIHFPSESGAEFIETTTMSTLSKSRGDNCLQYNGSIGVCLATKHCLQQQPKQKLWRVCEWPNFSRIPKTICCFSETQNLNELFTDTNHTTNQTINEEENDEELEINKLKCGLTKIGSKDIIMPPVRGRRDVDNQFDILDFLFPLSSRVVMGHGVKVGQIPWMCAIYFRGQFLCGGSIISERHIISAAHCFDGSLDPSEYHVRVGSVVLFNGTKYRLSRIVQHEKYFKPRIYHDIAIATVKDRISFTDEILPICLPKKKMLCRYLSGKMVFVSGFGDLSYGGAPASVLQEVDLKIINNTVCEENYRNLIESKTKFPVGIGDSLICAGHEEGGKDACQGDSGGPLSINVDGKSFLLGIVSFGYKCAIARFPGVYMCVTYYLNWIRRNLN